MYSISVFWSSSFMHIYVIFLDKNVDCAPPRRLPHWRWQAGVQKPLQCLPGLHASPRSRQPRCRSDHGAAKAAGNLQQPAHWHVRNNGQVSWQSVCQSWTKLCPFTSPPQASALIAATESLSNIDSTTECWDHRADWPVQNNKGETKAIKMCLHDCPWTLTSQLSFLVSLERNINVTMTFSALCAKISLEHGTRLCPFHGLLFWDLLFWDAYCRTSAVVLI